MNEKRIIRMSIAAAGLAFFLCLSGGIWILWHIGFDPDDPIGTGLGLYFTGKALFVGPMLIVAALQLGKRSS